MYKNLQQNIQQYISQSRYKIVMKQLTERMTIIIDGIYSTVVSMCIAKICPKCIPNQKALHM